MVLRRSGSFLRSTACAVVLTALAACAHVPFDAPRTTTSANPEFGAALDPVSRAVLGAESGQSAYFELQGGTEALGTRLRMIEVAQHTIDIATFLIKPDTATSILAYELLAAAERGVRVRLLVDDVFTTANDEDLAILDSHPNLEVRRFNPSSRNAPKFMSFVLDFARVNRRMHIKTFVVDNSMAIIGGRNFADEYYRLKPSEEFADYDVAIIGREAVELNPIFDAYWNDRFSVPVANLRPASKKPIPPISQSDWSFDPDSPEVLAYQEAIDAPFLKRVANGEIPPYRGTSYIVADPPEKLRNENGFGPHTLGNAFFDALGTAKSSVTLITPYFVPEDYGADFYTKLAKSGIRVRVVTNSLSSNNHPYVHGGLMRHRDRLLAAGMEFYEVRHDAAQALGLVDPDDKVRITLHTKLAVIDDTSVFVGSLNLDPRSIRTNAEVGLFVQSPAYARAVLADLDTALPQFAYRVTRDPNATSQTAFLWTHAPTQGSNPPAPRVTTDEPDASGWRKFVAKVPIWLGLEFLL